MQPRTKWFRFTIRELLFAGIALACIVAMYVSRPPSRFRASEFSCTFTLAPLMEELQRDGILTCSPIVSGNGFSSHGPHSHVTHYRLRDLDADDCRAVVAKLNLFVRRSIEGADVRQTGSGGGTYSDERSRNRSFDYEYKNRHVYGVAFVNHFATSDGILISVIIQESLIWHDGKRG